MRYLVTGAQGFTGRFLCAELLRTGSATAVVGTGRSTPSRAFTHTVTWRGSAVTAPSPIELHDLDPERYSYVACDLNDAARLDRLVRESAPDCVFHLAAALRDDPADALIRTNVAGTAALVRALAGLTAKPVLVLGSSGSAYGIPETLPLRESARCAPHEPYAMSKLAAELSARVVADEANIRLAIARIFNIAGPGQEERHVCGRFAAQAAAIAAGDVPPVIEVGDLRPTRDFIDVRDVVGALICIADHARAGEIYNVASGIERSIADVLDLTLRAAGLAGRVQTVERYARAGDFGRAYADISKLRDCGFVARYPLEQTVAELVTYYRVDVANASSGGPVTSATSSSVTGTPSSQG